jgi:hypothetical protein
MTDADCNDGNVCHNHTCNTTTGMCDNSAIPDGPVPGFMDMVKDCKTQKCVGGTQMTVPDNADVPPSGNPCVTNSCGNGMVLMSDVNAGMSCGPNNQVCDGQGNCVGCTMSNPCADPGACKSVACTMNKCVVSNDPAETPCTAGGTVCDGNGNCVGCVSATDCTSGNCQNGMCGLAINGHTCTMSSQCQSGHCRDGFCCNGGCTNTCMACSNALTGQMNGQCNPIQSGKQAPNGQCAQATCGNDGNCDGNGGCEQVPAGTMCAMAACVGNSFHPPEVCTGGMCPTGTAMPCAPYVCTTSGCPNTCTMKSQCSSGNTCLPGGTCGPPLANGSPCTDPSQCTNPWCYGTPKVCQANSCMDGVTDGGETDVDCGGATACPRCGSGAHCTQGSDCSNGNCNGPPGMKTCQ